MPTNLSRRKIIKWAIVLGLPIAISETAWKLIRKKNIQFSGSIVGANYKVGHLLRTGIQGPTPSEEIQIDTIIVGAGISGLSAGRWFIKNNYTQFTILEMNDAIGGNSLSGENSISKYPWGAHYVPLPTQQSKDVIDFFHEIGLIKDFKDQIPIYDDFAICSAPHERLFFQGRWQEGLLPLNGISEIELKQNHQFMEYIETLKDARGKDGKIIFSIPLDQSSQDPEYLKLDSISMEQFLDQRGWDSPSLRWYVNYCCRDDYGAGSNKVSAWAGLHYFASRTGKAVNANQGDILTWPEGNAFLVNHLKKNLMGKIKTNSLVYSIKSENDKLCIDVLDHHSNQKKRYIANHIIYCGPRYTAKNIIQNYTPDFNLEFYPWLIANISLKQAPDTTDGNLGWDNVNYYSKSLGYIIATHQTKSFGGPTVITYYKPLDENSAETERHNALKKSHQQWCSEILEDLQKCHPTIQDQITHIDLWVWGHGMPSPGINYIWNKKRTKMQLPFKNIHFAHSEMSGISIFEEAFYQGIKSSRTILAKMSNTIV